MTRRTLLAQLALSRFLSAQSSPAPVPAPAVSAPPDTDPFHQLRGPHPRVLLLDADFDRLRLLARENALAKRIYGDLEKECDRLLSVPPVEYKLSGPRLQVQTRRAIDRITTLALMYRLSGRDPWLRRAMLEMNAAAAFKDWNPGRLIDTAEMTHAFAIGYDWLYNALTPEERTSVRNAIVSKGLEPVAAIYDRANPWSRERPHWNLVCNGAFTMGALAVAESTPDSPAMLRPLVRNAIDSALRGIQTYGPDGGWPEGAANGEYALRYACLMASSLETAAGSDYGLAVPRTLDRAARFRIYLTSGANRTFNYAGSADEARTAPELFWISRRLSNPTFAWMEQKEVERAPHSEPLDLAWFERDSKPPAPNAWPLDAVFHNAQVASFRGAWEDPNAIFLAIKGGDNKTGRLHTDLGSFVLDAGGVRWAVDPDPGENPAPVVPPWVTRTESHNTLLIDNENQDMKAEAAITHQDLGADVSWAQIDLSKTNGTKLRQWTRRAGLIQRQAALIEDTLKADQPIDALWGMVTDAEITVNGTSALLKKNGWNLAVDIRTPRHAVFDTAPVGPSFRKLIVRLGDKTADLGLSILLTPYKDGQTKPKITGQFPAA